MTNVDNLFKMWENNFEKMVKKDKEAQRIGDLEGRYLRFPIADGYAYYEIVKENKKSVRIEVIKNIGDDWVIPQLGEKVTIQMAPAVQNIKQRVQMENLFN